MNKELYFDSEMSSKILAGAKKVTKAVASTLGPAGRTVIIERDGISPLCTKDGISVAKNVTLKDHTENLGAKLVTDASDYANQISGDGSTTTTILAEAIMEEGVKAVSTGVNPVYLKKGVDAAVEDVVAELKKMSVEIETKEQIQQVATISANNDEKLGALIADAIEQVGNDGVVTINESKTSETTVDFVEGMSFPNTLVSPYLFPNPETMTVDYEDPCILITNKKLTATDDLLTLLEQVRQAGKQLVIIAPSVEGELLTTLIVNNMRGVIQAVAVKAPGFGDRQKDMLEDLAILCGTEVINEEIGMKMSSVDIAQLGSAKNVKITKDATTIVDGLGTSEDIASRVNQIKKEVEEATSDYDKEKLKERLARLAGGVSVIRIGATTEAEAKELRYRVEDAVNSARAACDEGIIPGGGSAFAHIATALKDKSSEGTDDYKKGYNIVLRSIEKPIKQIAQNAGECGEVILNKVQESSDNIGYDALHKNYKDLIGAGIIDPTKVARVALEKAASVATLFLTSNCVIVNEPEEEKHCGCGGCGSPAM